LAQHSTAQHGTAQRGLLNRHPGSERQHSVRPSVGRPPTSPRCPHAGTGPSPFPILAEVRKAATTMTHATMSSQFTSLRYTCIQVERSTGVRGRAALLQARRSAAQQANMRRRPAKQPSRAGPLHASTTAHHNTAQHSTAQHSTAQHGLHLAHDALAGVPHCQAWECIQMNRLHGENPPMRWEWCVNGMCA